MVSPVSAADAEGAEGVVSIAGAGAGAAAGGGGGAVLATTGCEVCDHGILIDEIVLHPAAPSITKATIAAAGALGRMVNSGLLIGFS
ncbi:MAG TPA: hypothetical protein VEF07_12620 [Candidatus Binataceae bacterium]|nr:hypothetical protein [Candidatus Binataceae bacterium]